MNDNKKPNKLINEKSPYLLQHAYNPVDWYPWGEEAFSKALKENKPIFLSIGYSTCHWCHVMEHESFEDSTVADLMNQTFISIKVDREEQPDIDNIYMTVCQMMTGHGGWPLTIIMTPEKKPFFAGTYFPKETRFGRIGLIELIGKVEDAWKNKRSEIENSAERITQVIQGMDDEIGNVEIGNKEMESAFNHLLERFDNKHGGFGDSPKFPSPHNLSFLLRYWKRTGNEKALFMVEKTLTEMRKGGVYDQIGFGFHRYSTDNEWLLPHFEKMLYDQALLSNAYIEAFQATHNNEFAKTAGQIFQYVLRDMTSPEGGFYSAEDADSDGEEGKFYVWSVDEIKNILDDESANFFVEVYNFEESGNFIEETTKSKTGNNIPHLRKSYKELASKFSLSENELDSKIENIREQLFDFREKRIHPYKDDKILTDWNGLMIASLAKGARVLNNKEYEDAAVKSAQFILTKLRESNGRLIHRYRDGEAAITPSIDDYAFFIWGLLELYETTFEVTFLKNAIELQNIQIEHFWDKEKFGFFFSPDDGEKLLTRTKEVYDGAIPSGNSVAMMNLLKLSRLTANPEYEELASQMSKSFSVKIENAPAGSTMMLQAIDFAIGPTFEVILIGNRDNDKMIITLIELNNNFIPNKVTMLKSYREESDLEKVAPFIKNYVEQNNETTIFVCENFVCNLPTNDPQKMLELLEINQN